MVSWSSYTTVAAYDSYIKKKHAQKKASIQKEISLLFCISLLLINTYCKWKYYILFKINSYFLKNYCKLKKKKTLHIS